MNLIGIITRALLGIAPAPGPAPTPAQHVDAAPLVMAPAAGTTAVPSASEVVDRVQKFYASIEQVTASFRQAVTYDTFGSTKTSDGKLWIQKPGKMRWDYLGKKKQEVVIKKSFVSNGSYLYAIEHENKQVLKKDLKNDLMPVAISFLYGKGDLKAEFTAEVDKTGKYGTKADIVLRLTPKQPSAQYKNLYLVVSTSDFHVSQSVIVDSSNNINHFRFFAPDFKAPIKGTWFEFDERSVRDYRIVDADRQQDKPAGSGLTVKPGTTAPPLPAPLAAPVPAPVPAPKK